MARRINTSLPLGAMRAETNTLVSTTARITWCRDGGHSFSRDGKPRFQQLISPGVSLSRPRRLAPRQPFSNQSGGGTAMRIKSWTTAVADGDALSASVAAASIVAKVTRDSLMEEYAQLSWIRLRTAQGLRHPGSYFRAGTARAVAASSLVICASVASGRRQPQLALWGNQRRAGL